VSLDDQPRGQFVSDVAVQSVSFSDHRLVTCRLGVPLTQQVTTTYSYRPLRKIDTVAFGRDILRSRLYDSTVADADEYAELFDAEVKRVLYIQGYYVPAVVVAVASMTFFICQTRRRKPCSSAVGLNVVRRTRLWSLIDAPVCLLNCSAARDSIIKSRADHIIKAKLDEVAGDIGATWRTAQNLLHNNHKVVYSSHVFVFPLPSLFKFSSRSRGNLTGITCPWELSFLCTPLSLDHIRIPNRLPL